MSSAPRRRVLASWSSGKDSAWMLHVLRQDPDVEVVGLVTTFAAATDRVAMHGVPRSLVERQAIATGMPLRPVFLPWPRPNAEYEARMSDLFRAARADGVTHIAFGDLFLEEIRDDRIRQLAGTRLEPLFPIWCGPERTAELARKMIEAGLRATLTCVDSRQLDPAFVGRPFDADLLRDLPPSVDPCGERGEFHTFCWAGPHQAVTAPLAIRTAAAIARDGFLFAGTVLLAQTQRATVTGGQGGQKTTQPPCRRRRFDVEPWQTARVPLVDRCCMPPSPQRSPWTPRVSGEGSMRHLVRAWTHKAFDGSRRPGLRRAKGRCPLASPTREPLDPVGRKVGLSMRFRPGTTRKTRGWDTAAGLELPVLDSRAAGD